MKKEILIGKDGQSAEAIASSGIFPPTFKGSHVIIVLSEDVTKYNTFVLNNQLQNVEGTLDTCYRVTPGMVTKHKDVLNDRAVGCYMVSQLYNDAVIKRIPMAMAAYALYLRRAKDKSNRTASAFLMYTSSFINLGNGYYCAIADTHFILLNTREVNNWGSCGIYVAHLTKSKLLIKKDNISFSIYSITAKDMTLLFNTQLGFIGDKVLKPANVQKEGTEDKPRYRLEMGIFSDNMRVSHLYAILTNGAHILDCVGKDGKTLCDNHHRNGNPWDNRPENLVVGTGYQHANWHKGDAIC